MASDPQLIAAIACRACGAELDPPDRYCRWCGAATAPAGTAAWLRRAAADDASTQPRGGLDNPWLILFLLLFVLGPLALPLLWRSRSFTPAAKAVLTVVVSLVTVAGLYVVWYQFQQIQKLLSEPLKLGS